MASTGVAVDTALLAHKTNLLLSPTVTVKYNASTRRNVGGSSDPIVVTHPGVTCDTACITSPLSEDAVRRCQRWGAPTLREKYLENLDKEMSMEVHQDLEKELGPLLKYTTYEHLSGVRPPGQGQSPSCRTARRHLTCLLGASDVSKCRTRGQGYLGTALDSQSVVDGLLCPVSKRSMKISREWDQRTGIVTFTLEWGGPINGSYDRTRDTADRPTAYTQWNQSLFGTPRDWPVATNASDGVGSRSTTSTTITPSELSKPGPSSNIPFGVWGVGQESTTEHDGDPLYDKIISEFVEPEPGDEANANGKRGMS